MTFRGGVLATRLGGVVAVALIGMAAAPEARGDEGTGNGTEGATPIVVTGSATYASRYLFQGIDYSDGLPVVQPEVTLSLGALSVGVWGNVDRDQDALNELDTTVRVAWERGRVSGSLGVAYLEYPNRPEDWVASREVVADFGFEAPVAPTLSLHGDLRGGGYAVAGLARELPARFVTIGLGARLYGQHRYDGRSGLSAAEARVGAGGSWHGLSWEAAGSRFTTWENGDFRGEDAIPSRWLFTVTVSAEWSRGGAAE